MRDRHVNSIPWKLYVEVYAGDHGPQEMQPSTSHEDQGSVLEEVILWGRRWSLPVKRLNFPGGGKSLCAAAAKSLQLCPTLCHPIDGSPPGSAIPGILQYSCLESSMDRGAWQATIHGVVKSQTQLSHWTQTHTHVIPHILSFLLSW